eukprot:scaffold219380_cov29-Tisochrysis_lutea.AAC.1
MSVISDTPRERLTGTARSRSWQGEGTYTKPPDDLTARAAMRFYFGPSPSSRPRTLSPRALHRGPVW